jgi:subtilase family serine protease
VDQNSSGTPESVAQFGLAVNFPASSPFVTGVGGTEFDEAQGSFWNSSGNAVSYIAEIAWNDTATLGVLSGSGGGASQQFIKPVWQAGTGVPADGQRDVPDIAPA